MARYEHLPLYKAVYELNLYFYKLSSGLPKTYKFSLAAEIQKLLSELLDHVIIANNSQEKTDVLMDSLVIIERLKNKYRILMDLGTISTRQYGFVARQLIEISQQFEKWKSWAQRDDGRNLPYFSQVARKG